MAKVYTWMVTCIGLIMLFQFAGLPTGFDTILEWIGFDTTGSNSGMMVGFFVLLAAAIFTLSLAIGGTITLGFISTTTPESKLIASFAGAILIIFASVSIIITTNAFTQGAWIGAITTLLLTPLNVGFILSLVSWWKGTD